ncbi:MAG TPA: hypothetical protein VG899_09695 [Mycobacteriales bacterium]|nr:hypothetical protein [Mycobacteriales bacterium]
MNALEQLVSEACDDGAVTGVIRPAAIVPETAGREILAFLSLHDVRMGGPWLPEPTSWRRYDQPWNGADRGPGTAQLLGTIQIIHGTPTRFEITLFRATITLEGRQLGYTVTSLCDEALGYGGLSLATCPRAKLSPPPQPFRFGR